jgi:hypothetical protein
MLVGGGSGRRVIVSSDSRRGEGRIRPGGYYGIDEKLATKADDGCLPYPISFSPSSRSVAVSLL